MGLGSSPVTPAGDASGHKETLRRCESATTWLRRIREVDGENTQVHFTKRTHRQSPDQESRTTPCETKRYKGIVKSTTKVTGLNL